MPTLVTPQKLAVAGMNPVYNAVAADGIEFVNNETIFIIARNTSASAITVTVQTPATYDGLALADLTISIPANESRILGFFSAANFSNSAGKVVVTSSAPASTTIAVISTR